MEHPESDPDASFIYDRFFCRNVNFYWTRFVVVGILLHAHADVAELVDALISGVSGETRADSNSVIRTIEEEMACNSHLFFIQPYNLQRKRIHHLQHVGILFAVFLAVGK